jgi:hypothetical protein
LKFAERHFSADDDAFCARAGALPDDPISKAATTDAIVGAVPVRKAKKVNIFPQ